MNTFTTDTSENHGMTNDIIQKSIPNIKILWTGGFDSTFRVLQLSMLPVVIQPYYLSDNRKSENNELSAINSITKLILNRKETKCELLPIEIIATNQRKLYPEISDSFRKLVEKETIGSQYEWLACFAKNYNGIELSIEENTKPFMLMEKYDSKLQLIQDSIIGDYYVLDKHNTQDIIYTIFGNYHYPLAKVSKLKMKEYYLKWNCNDIMNLTWFCHNPVNGKPCGLCSPCCQVIKYGMYDRFTKWALIKHRLLPVRKLLKKICI